MRRALAVWCLVIFHSLDGSELWVRADAVDVIQPGEPHHDHVAKGVNSILFISGGKGRGILESGPEAAKMIKQCQ